MTSDINSDIAFTVPADTASTSEPRAENSGSQPFWSHSPFWNREIVGDPLHRSLSLQAHITDRQSVVCKENIPSYSKRILIASLRVLP